MDREIRQVKPGPVCTWDERQPLHTHLSDRTTWPYTTVVRSPLPPRSTTPSLRKMSGTHPLHSQSIIRSHLAHTLSKFKRKAVTCDLKLGDRADESVLKVAYCLYRKHAGFVAVYVIKLIGMAAIRSQSSQGGSIYLIVVSHTYVAEVRNSHGREVVVFELRRIWV
jgi:hypothetical protein